MTLDHDRITNQSVVVVMRHLLTHMGHGSEADHQHAQHLTAEDIKEFGVEKFEPGWVGSTRYGRPRPNVSLADLSPGQLQVAYMAVMLLLALAWWCERRFKRTHLS